MSGPYYDNLVYIQTLDWYPKLDSETGAPNIVWSRDRYRGGNVIMCHPIYFNFLRDMFFAKRATKVLELPEDAHLEKTNWT